MFCVSLFEDHPFLVDIKDEIPIKHRLPSEPLSEKSSTRQSTTSAIFSVHGNHIISGTSKGFINIIETTSLRIIHSSKLSTGLFSLLRLTSNGRQLLANSTDRIIRVIDMPDLSKLRPSSDDLNGEINDDDPHDGYLDPSTIYLSATNQFTDVVNRLRWNHTSISPVASGSDTAEYVVASTCIYPAVLVFHIH
jgi:COMPASS component SWD1